jgi:hypothetical protein
MKQIMQPKPTKCFKKNHFIPLLGIKLKLVGKAEEGLAISISGLGTDAKLHVGHRLYLRLYNKIEIVDAGSNGACFAGLLGLGTHVEFLRVNSKEAKRGNDLHLCSLCHGSRGLSARFNSHRRIDAERFGAQCQALELDRGRHAGAFHEGGVSSCCKLGAGYIANREAGGSVSMNRGGVYGEKEDGESEEGGEGGEGLHCERSMYAGR